jgi:hypothetical protein
MVADQVDRTIIELVVIWGLRILRRAPASILA